MSLLSIALQFSIISLYISKRQRCIAQNLPKVAERLTFTMRASKLIFSGFVEKNHSARLSLSQCAGNRFKFSLESSSDTAHLHLVCLATVAKETIVVLHCGQAGLGEAWP